MNWWAVGGEASRSLTRGLDLLRINACHGGRPRSYVAKSMHLLTIALKMQHTGEVKSQPINQEQAVLALAAKHPLLRARDLAAEGLPTVILSRLVAAEKLERVARGVYGLPGRQLSEHHSLAEVALRVPSGVICLLSALRVHGIGTQAPFEVWLAIPRSTQAPRMAQPALRLMRMSGAALSEGIESKLIDGVAVPVFNAAKTVADCFKYRNKIGLDVALEALRDGWEQRKFTMDTLWHFAAIDRMTNVMRPYLESLTT
jgi:predicted transcriptional regulator of viral defense system